MNPLTPDAIAALATTALERTAFMLSEQTEASAKHLAQATRCAVIEYRGPSAGSVGVRATPAFLRALAAGLLGIEPSEVTDEASATDALKELGNLLGGSVVLALGGPDSAYSLGLPGVVDPKDPRIAGAADAVLATLDCEGELLQVIWTPGASSGARAA